MKALILNSGMGKRMGILTSEHPKCMTEISATDTILSRQLRIIADAGITDVVMTTGLFDDILVKYCKSLGLPLNIVYINNPIYAQTNYIYSIYCVREYVNDDIVLIHGDMVFEAGVFAEVISSPVSCIAVSSALPLPDKDFKAEIHSGLITKVGVEFFDDAVAAQPLYLLKKDDWAVWLDEIIRFCENGQVKCYAENALNNVLDRIKLCPTDAGDRLCCEIDTAEDLELVSKRLEEIENRTVYMCFSSDILHGGHVDIIRKAARLGKLTIGVLSDEAVASYKRFPLLPYHQRVAMFENIKGVSRVVEQRTLSYNENLEKYKPDFVVHGDDWVAGFQKPIRDEVVRALASYGGRLVEYPYSRGEVYTALEARTRKELSLPDIRRSRLRKLLAMKKPVTAMEAHSGITGLIVENTVVHVNGETRQFDCMWISSLCDSTSKGKPDMELVDMTSRFRTIDDIMEVTTKPIIFDGDTGGLTDHFVYTVRTLERIGVSMVIIEDKTGLKRNSLFGTEVEQTQAAIEDFAAKILAGKKAQKTRDFMICARIESLILERGMDDALARARAYVAAGADAIMIHSRRKEPDEIFKFAIRFRDTDAATPLVVVPTSFNEVTEEEFAARNINIVIYANQLTRAGFPAMRGAAQMILTNRRAKECDDICMPFKEIIRLIPQDI